MGNLLWLDLETTGLEPREDRILECGVLVTTPDLAIVHEACALVEPGDLDAIFARAHERVISMHEASGLWGDLLDPAQPKIAPAELAGWLSDIARSTGCSGVASDGSVYRSPLCGSSVHFDRAFLSAHAPVFLRDMSYRNIDVSTIHELCSRWYTTRHGEGSTPAHRTIADLHFSIDRLRWYRAHHFSPYGRTAQ